MLPHPNIPINEPHTPTPHNLSPYIVDPSPPAQNDIKAPVIAAPDPNMDVSPRIDGPAKRQWIWIWYIIYIYFEKHYKV